MLQATNGSDYNTYRAAARTGSGASPPRAALSHFDIERLARSRLRNYYAAEPLLNGA